ncbi:MAG: tRNA pseudouridine(38-40) synthase TruA [Actinomycetota bacterium]|nr:tRNA pseudouridine(38-40) synthase TruA [Actinomycetota bacterium]
MPTYRIDLAYDGTGFHGYGRQDNVRTVQGDLETALFRVTGEVKTAVAGRTDAGVHATGQVVSFFVDEPLDTKRLQRSLNAQLGPEIAATAITEVGDRFHARFSAVERRYRYRISNRPVHDPLTARTAWHVKESLDVDAMNEAVEGFVGVHDFASLCRKAPGRTTVREVLAARWVRTDDIVELSIGAVAFCHQMVRSIVTTSVDVGKGRSLPEDVPAILDARSREVVRGLAPPHGLTLAAVVYDESNGGAVPSWVVL